MTDDLYDLNTICMPLYTLYRIQTLTIILAIILSKVCTASHLFLSRSMHVLSVLLAFDSQVNTVIKIQAVACLACARIGAPFVPIDDSWMFDSNGDRLGAIIADAKPVAAIVVGGNRIYMSIHFYYTFTRHTH
jgi:hypothetical protein